MEIIIATTIVVSIVLTLATWAYVRITQHKIEHGNPKEIEKLRAEMAEYKRIINMLDQEALEELEKKVSALVGDIRSTQVSRFTGR